MTEQAAAATEPQPMTIAQAANAFAKLDTSPEPQERQPEPEGVEGTPEAEPSDGEQEPTPALEEEDGTQEEEQGEPEGESGQTLVEVTLPGGEKAKLTLEELAKGYSRESDYTKKTQELAQQRSQIQAEMQRAQAERRAYVERIQQVEAFLESSEPKISPEQWAEWEQYDPARFAAEKIKFSERQQQKANLRAQREHLDRQTQLETVQALKEFVSTQKPILEQHIPEAKDPQKWEAKQAEMRTFLKEFGYQDAEIDQFYDARVVRLAYEAMKGRANVSKTQIVAKKLAEAPKMVPSTAAPSRYMREKAGLQAAARQLQQTGSIRDAANFFSKIKL